jgi:hypothetical protein
MSLGAETRLLVRQRANFACEYCGVSETDSGGELTIDLFQPQIEGGSNDLANLLYCCNRCNQYKSDYWPHKPDDPFLWNPRKDPRESHLLPLAEGLLYPITPVGAFTLKRLRLNRPPLIASRLRRQYQAEEVRLLTRYRDTVAMLGQLHQQQVALLEEQRSLLEEQRALVAVLLSRQK